MICRFLESFDMLISGKGGIRTPDTLAGIPHFECGPFNHFGTFPF